MPSYRTSFTKGFLIGAGAAAAVAAAQYAARRRGVQQQLIDWDRATRFAVQACGDGTLLRVEEKVQLLESYEELVRGIEGPIAQFTGTTLPLGSTRVQVMDRVDWIYANVANFRELFAPLDEFYAKVAQRSPLGLPVLGDAGRLLLSAQTGLLIGYLARKVLGQYDISLLGKEPISPGKLYFVEPNIRNLESALDVPGRELRLWIALHEATHAHEFEVYPWVRGYLNSHLQAYLRTVIQDLEQESTSPGAIAAAVNRLLTNLRRGQHLLEALMTPEQRQILSKLQALMTLAEGYSNYVMNNVGRRLLPHYAEIQARVEQRQRQRGQAEELFLRLTGLKMKLEQYALGEQFAARVAAERGMAFLNRAWQSAELLPSEEELRAPERWIARVDQLAA